VTGRPEAVERDSRGILDPWLLRERVQLTRYPPSPALAGLVDRFWAVCWDLPAGLEHRQGVLTHPGANLSIGSGNADPGADQNPPIEARLNGVARGLSTRLLVGRGWAVAAMTTPGGLGAFLSTSAAEFTDRVVSLGEAGLGHTGTAVNAKPVIKDLMPVADGSTAARRSGGAGTGAVRAARSPRW